MASAFPPRGLLSVSLSVARSVQFFSPHLFRWLLDWIVNPFGDVVALWLSKGVVVKKPCSCVAGAVWLMPGRVEADTGSAVMFMPGGAFIVRSPTAVPFANALFEHLGASGHKAPPILVVNYPLPGRPGANLECAKEALRWLQEQGLRVIVAGDSAGGMLAVQLGMHMHEGERRSKSAIAGVIGIDPWLDLTLTAAAHARNRDKCVLHKRFLALGAAEYSGCAEQQALASLSPARGDGAAESLASLPSNAMLLVRSSEDILADDSCVFKQRVIDSGGKPDAISIIDVDGPHAAHDVILWPGARSEHGASAFRTIAQYVARAFRL